jgi:hypothetical protein
MSAGITMKIQHIQGEILLAAADSDLVNREIREGKLHLKIAPEFYGETKVSDETFLSSMGLCTIANLVGKHVVDLAIRNSYVDRENIIYIDRVPHAQFAKLIE